MDRHLKMIGIYNIAVGVVGLVIVALTLIFSGGPSGVLLINARQGGLATTFEGMVTAFYLGFLFLMAGPLIAVGFGLLRFQEWARNLGMILSILSLIHIPFGTIVGIYSLWVLTSHEVEPLFQAPPARTTKFF